MAEIDVENVLVQLDLKEKVSLTAGQYDSGSRRIKQKSLVGSTRSGRFLTPIVSLLISC